MTREPEPWTVAARHEAGHAVVAHLLGAEVRWVRVDTDEDDLDGETSVAWPALDAAECASRSGRAALAGPLAEMDFLGHELLEDPRALASWARDWDEAMRCARAADGANPEARIHQWVAEVGELLREPTVAERVARVADALAAHGEIDACLFADCFD